ncbi:MAG: acyl-protein synthetase [Verrucomicrobiota bacterium]
MEAPWDDLSHEGEEVDSPSWHEAVLRETAERVASGDEVPLDWAAPQTQDARLEDTREEIDLTTTSLALQGLQTVC